MIRQVVEHRDETGRPGDRERFAAATLDALSEHVAVLDARGTVVAANRAWREFAVANSPSPQGLGEGANYFAACARATGAGAEDAARFAAGLRAVIGGEQVEFSLEYPCHSPVEQRWFIARATRFEFGGEVCAVVTHANITSRKLAEAAIHFQSHLLNTVEQAVIATDLSGTIIYWNRFAEQLYGWPATEIIGRNIMEVILPQASQEQASEVMSRLQAGQSWSGEFTVRRRDGTTFPAFITDTPIYDSEGIIVGIVGVSGDITGRRLTEQRLAQSEEQLRAIFEASRDGILVEDGETIVYANRAYAHTLGYDDPDDLRGRHISSMVAPQDAARMMDYGLLRLAGMTPPAVYEFKGMRKDGSLVDLEASVSTHDVAGNMYITTSVRDISERKRAEEERERLLRSLEAERTRLAYLFRHAPTFVAVLRGPDHTFELANPPYMQIIGHRDVLGKPAREALPEVEGQGFFELLDEVFRTGEPYVGRATRILIRREAEGPPEERFLDFVYQPVFDADEAVTGIFVHGVDITEHKRVEDSLKQLSNRIERQLHTFNTVVSSVQDFIYMFDLQGRFTYMNKSLLDLWQKTFEQAVGKNFYELDYPPDLADKLQRQIQEVITTRRPLKDETPYTSAFGTRAYEYIFVPLVAGDGAVEAVAGVTRDITERKHAEEALKESESKYRLLMEQASDGIHTYDPRGNIIETNSKLCEMLGYTREELLRLNVKDLIPPDDLASAPLRFDELQAGRTLLTERSLRRRDGTFLPVEISGRMIRDGVLQSIVRDISERKRVEEELRRAYDELERRVEERTAELARTNETLKAEIAERLRAGEARKELLRRLVTAQEDERRRISRELHDQLGQRLTALMMGLKALDTDSYGRRSALDGLQRLQELTDELSREAHTIAWRLRPAALDDLGLHTALHNYAEDWAGRSRVRVDFHAAGFESGRLPPAHETALYRIAQEALTNIHKHARADRVSIIMERRADHVLAVIEDDGEGFDVEALMELSPRRRNLGLMGMRERAALLGGTLDVESTPGAGTSVFVRIPVGAGGGEEGASPHG